MAAAADASTYSYLIILPVCRHLIFVNAEPGKAVDKRVLTDPSETVQVRTVESHEDTFSLLYGDKPRGPYTTLSMEFTTDDEGSLATAAFMHSSSAAYTSTAFAIAELIVYRLDVAVSSDEEEEEEEEEEDSNAEMSIVVKCVPKHTPRSKDEGAILVGCG